VFLFPSSDGEFTFKETNNKLHRVIEAENLALFYHCGMFYRLEESCVFKMDLTELPYTEVMKIYVYVPSYVVCFILYTFKYFLSTFISQLRLVKKSLYTIANMLDKVKIFLHGQILICPLLYKYNMYSLIS